MRKILVLGSVAAVLLAGSVYANDRASPQLPAEGVGSPVLNLQVLPLLVPPMGISTALHRAEAPEPARQLFVQYLSDMMLAPNVGVWSDWSPGVEVENWAAVMAKSQKTFAATMPGTSTSYVHAINPLDLSPPPFEHNPLLAIRRQHDELNAIDASATLRQRLMFSRLARDHDKTSPQAM